VYHFLPSDWSIAQTATQLNPVCCANSLALRASNSTVIKNCPDEKSLQTASFIAHATRGVIRDQKTRRKAMVVLLALAVLMLIGGFTIFQSALNPREHPWFVILFWIGCVWLTFTALLLALFDLIVIRLEARRAQRVLRERLESEASNK
jgi:hypothetical protein